MTDSDFVTVFNVATDGYRNWWFPTLGMIFVAIGGGLLTFSKAGIFSVYQKKGLVHRTFPILFLGFSVLWTVTAFGVTFGGYWLGREELFYGKTMYVEGAVDNFVAMVPHRNEESFSVDGVPFTYSDYRISPGFHQTEAGGGPIHAGTYVRIWYLGNDILKLQVRK